MTVDNESEMFWTIFSYLEFTLGSNNNDFSFHMLFSDSQSDESRLTFLATSGSDNI